MRARLAVIALAALTAGSCDLNGPGVGDLAITVATSGGDLDLDGYTLTVDSHQVTSEVHGTHYFLSLPTGPHTVTLDGVAENCQLPDGGATREAVVRADDTVRVHFGLFCVTTGVSASITTEGLDLDNDGYLLSVGNAPPAPVPTNGTVAITRLPEGTHSLTLAGRAANCEVAADNPTSVSLARGDLTPVSFAVTCTATGGVIEITAVTSGLDPDDGYAIRFDGAGTPIRVPANGTVRLMAVPGGTHAVMLDGVASNCTVPPDPRTVTIRTGGLTRDTARTRFEVSCVAATGVLEVTTVTTGVDLDPDGYRVEVDSGAPQAIGLNATIRMSGVPGGDRSVLLSDVAPNCAVEGPNPRPAAVAVGGATRDTVRITFALTCEPAIGIARVITHTTGTQLDPDGYTMGIDCYGYYYSGDCYYSLHYETMGLWDTVTVSNVPTGAHTFQLDGVALNCTVAGENPRSVRVAGGTTTDIVFSIECAAPGSLEVTVTTTGMDLDANGYLVTVHGERKSATQNLPANGRYTFTEMFAGSYAVSLSGVSLNCEVTGASTAMVTVPSGGAGMVSFNASCVTARQLAFSNGDIHVWKTNDGAPTRLAAHSSYDDGPAWSPDGSRIAFGTQRDGSGEIYLVNVDGTGLTRLTTHPGTDYGPSWSPDGARIAFSSDRDGNLEIYVINPDGSGVLRLTNHTANPDADPAWSPDGTRIAFHRGYGIHVMNANGSGVTQLTAGGGSVWDESPTWSPDGSRIAFARTGSCDYYYCERDLYVMNADGTGVVPLTSGPDDHGDPAWSPDGDWIVFNVSPCDYYYGCSNSGLRAVRSDGSGMRDLGLAGFHPAWRP